MATAAKPENQIFTFDGSSTIKDLLIVVKTLSNAGHKPKLRLVRSYQGEFESVAVDVRQLADEPPREMAVAGSERLPDPAPIDGPVSRADRRWSKVQAETPVFWEGEWTTWAALSGNERMECVFNGDGVIVGGYSI